MPEIDQYDQYVPCTQSPEEIRDQNWWQIKANLKACLWNAYRLWCIHGTTPITTRQFAINSHEPLLNVRPFTTKLVDLGLVRCVGRNGREGTYQVVTEGRAIQVWLEQHAYQHA